MHSVNGMCRTHYLAIDCKIDMFDKIIKPVLLYGCEVWCFHNTNLLEQLHLKFCKHTLNLGALIPGIRNKIIVLQVNVHDIYNLIMKT